MKEKKLYKYNMTLYYQSIVFYLISLLVYILLKAQFSKFSFNSLFNDNIFLFFLIIILYTVLSTLVNLIRRKYLAFDANGFEYQTRLKLKKFSLDNIAQIKIQRENKHNLNGILRSVKISFKDNKQNLVIRPIDYENEIEVLNEFRRLREKLETNVKEKNK